MKTSGAIRIFTVALALAFALSVQAQSTASKPEAVLHASDLVKILPASVFFRGQSATTQERNSGGVRFADGYLTVATLVDNSGYSTGLQQKYQAYLLTEVALDIEGHRLAPGAYGTGIVKGGDGLHFVVMDIGSHDLFQVAAASDAKLHRPTPLQVLSGNGPGKYRLYLGRNYVDFERAQ